MFKVCQKGRLLLFLGAKKTGKRLFWKEKMLQNEFLYGFYAVFRRKYLRFSALNEKSFGWKRFFVWLRLIFGGASNGIKTGCDGKESLVFQFCFFYLLLFSMQDFFARRKWFLLFTDRLSLAIRIEASVSCRFVRGTCRMLSLCQSILSWESRISVRWAERVEIRDSCKDSDCHFGRFYEMPFRREYILSDAVVFHPAATVRVLRRKRWQKSAPANVNATGKAIHIPAGPPWNVKPSR